MIQLIISAKYTSADPIALAVYDISEKDNFFTRNRSHAFMGGGLSRCFEPQAPAFTIDCWNVINTRSLTTGNHVSLWIIDPTLLTQRFPNSADRTAFIHTYFVSAQKTRKFKHPLVLQVYEIAESSNAFEFTTEPITSSLSHLIGRLTSTESCYFAFQILTTLHFLHNDAKVVHFGICPSSVFLTSDFSVKIFGFAWLTTLSDDGIVHPPFREYVVGPSCPPLRYSAPELVMGRQCSAQSDVFSWGAVFYEMLSGKPWIAAETKSEYKISEIEGAPLEELLAEALNPGQTLRQSCDRFLAHDAFQSVAVKSLIYLDHIVVKDPKDKFAFFKGFSKAMPTFSDRVLRKKVFPILIRECLDCPKFAPVLIGPIFETAKSFAVQEFTNDVYAPLASLAAISDPPEMLVAFVQQLDIIYDRTYPSIHQNKVTPIVITALKSGGPILLKELFKKFPLIAPLISETAIQKNVIPPLMRLAESPCALELIVGALNCITSCLAKVNHDQFLKYLVPRLANVYRLHPDPLIVQSLSELLVGLHGSVFPMLTYAVPLAAEIVGAPKTDAYYEQLLLSWMLAVLIQFKSSSEIDGAEDPIAIQSPEPPELTARFDALAEQLNLTEAERAFDGSFESPEPGAVL